MRPHELRKFRLSKGVPARDMVAVVQQLYPKYDKTIQSKCERGEDYGIQLRKDAMAALVERFAPEQIKGGDRHKRQCRIQCRLDDDVYEDLRRCVIEDGFKNTQEWLERLVITYLATRSRKRERGSIA